MNHQGTQLEIERKFHLRRWPESLPKDSGTLIAQGYLADSPCTVRLRRYGSDHFLTVKSGSGLVRNETEIPLTPHQFNQLWPLTESRRLEKMRYLLPFGPYTIEIDRFLGRLAPLIVAEVEFPSSEAAHAFQPPDFFGQELTGRSEFLNSQLAVAPAPPPLPQTELA